MTHITRRCSALRKDGRPCRAWAVRGSDPALCANHLDREPEASGFYERSYSIEEAADLLYKTAEKDLKEELGVTRVTLRRALEQMQQELDAAEYARLIELIFRGAHTIADIMRAQNSLSGGGEDFVPPVIGEVLTEIGNERGIEL